MIIVTVFEPARRGLGDALPESRFFTSEGAADFQATLTGDPSDGMTWDECWDEDDPEWDFFADAGPQVRGIFGWYNDDPLLSS